MLNWNLLFTFCIPDIPEYWHFVYLEYLSCIEYNNSCSNVNVLYHPAYLFIQTIVCSAHSLPVLSFSPTLCASLLEAGDGKQKSCRKTKHIVPIIKVAISVTKLSFMSLHQSSYWFVHTDHCLLVALLRALGVPITDYSFEDCQLAMAEGQLRLPVDTCLLEFSKLARRLGWVSQPFQCNPPIKENQARGKRVKQGQITHQTLQGSRFNIWQWFAFQRIKLVLCTGGGVWDCVLVAVLLTSIGWSCACTVCDLEGDSVQSTHGLAYWCNSSLGGERQNWQH